MVEPVKVAGGLSQGSTCLDANSIPSLVRRKRSRMRYFGATLTLNLVEDTPGLTLDVSKDILPTKSSLEKVQWVWGLRFFEFATKC